MTAADFLRFVIIVSLGVLAFVTFLVAGTIVGLMWLDSWSCGTCNRYPTGLYILGLLGILMMVSIGVEAGDAPATWGPWMKKNRDLLIIGAISFVALLVVMNSRWWF